MQSFQQSNAAQALYAMLQCSALALSECILPRLVCIPVNKIEAANLLSSDMSSKGIKIASKPRFQPILAAGNPCLTVAMHKAQQKVDLRDPLALRATGNCGE